jgi:hypothetical protein
MRFNRRVCPASNAGRTASILERLLARTAGRSEARGKTREQPDGSTPGSSGAKPPFCSSAYGVFFVGWTTDGKVLEVRVTPVRPETIGTFGVSAQPAMPKTMRLERMYFISRSFSRTRRRDDGERSSGYMNEEVPDCSGLR